MEERREPEYGESVGAWPTLSDRVDNPDALTPQGMAGRYACPSVDPVRIAVGNHGSVSWKRCVDADDGTDEHNPEVVVNPRHAQTLALHALILLDGFQRELDTDDGRTVAGSVLRLRRDGHSSEKSRHYFTASACLL